MNGGKGGGGMGGSRAPSRMGPGPPGAPSPTLLRPQGDSIMSVGPSPPIPMFPPGEPRDVSWVMPNRAGFIQKDVHF